MLQSCDGSGDCSRLCPAALNLASVHALSSMRLAPNRCTPWVHTDSPSINLSTVPRCPPPPTQIIYALGGEGRFRRLFVGWAWLGGWSYLRRVTAMREQLAREPELPPIAGGPGLVPHGYVRYAKRLP